MFVDKHLNSYVKKDKIVLRTETGPGGWMTATLCRSALQANHYELSVAVLSSGYVCLGVVNFELLQKKHFVKLHTSDEQIHICWHPSGKRVFLVVAGYILLCNVRWSEAKHNREVLVREVAAMLHNTPEDAIISDHLSVGITVWRQLYYRCTALVLGNAGSCVYVGCANGTISKVTWEGDLLSEVPLSTEYALLRLWETKEFPLEESIANRTVSVAEGEYLSLGVSSISEKDSDKRIDSINSISAAGNLNHTTSVRETISFMPLSINTASTKVDILSEDLNGDSLEYTTASSFSHSVYSLTWCERPQCLLALISDGSLVISQKQLFSLDSGTYSENSMMNASIAASFDDNAAVISLRHRYMATMRIHPIALVGYPLNPSFSAANASKKIYDPVIYELRQDNDRENSRCGFYNSKYVTEFDQLAEGNRKINITGKLEEEISQVIGAAAVGHTTTGDGSFKIVALLRTKHLPDTSFTSNTLDGQRSTGSVRRSQTVSLAVLHVQFGKLTNTTSLGKSSASGKSANRTKALGISCDQLTTLLVKPTSGSKSSHEKVIICGEPSDSNVGLTTSKAVALTLPDELLYNLEILYSSSHEPWALVNMAGLITCRPLDCINSLLFTVDARPTLGQYPIQINPITEHINPLESLHLMNFLYYQMYGCSVRVSVTTGHILICSTRVLFSSKADELPKNNRSREGATHAVKHFQNNLRHGELAFSADSTIVAVPLVAPILTKGSRQNLNLYINFFDATLWELQPGAVQSTAICKDKDSDNTRVPNDNSGVERIVQEKKIRLPKILRREVESYRSLIGVKNPFKPRNNYVFSQCGVLCSSSKQCLTSCIVTSLPIISKPERATKEYIAVVAGGSDIPFSRSTKIQNNSDADLMSQQPTLWIYNESSKRWRGTSLTIGNSESKAHSIRNITSVFDYQLQHHYKADLVSAPMIAIAEKNMKAKIRSLSYDEDSSPNSSAVRELADHHGNGLDGKILSEIILGNPHSLKSISVDSTESKISSNSIESITVLKRFKSEYVMDKSLATISETNTKSIYADRTPLKGKSPAPIAVSDSKTERRKSGSAMDKRSPIHYKEIKKRHFADIKDNSFTSPVRPASNICGPVQSVVGLAWLDDHTIVMINRRRSLFCLELMSREASPESLSKGNPQPFVHRIVPQSPGFLPNILQVESIVEPTDSHLNLLQGCILIGDGNQFTAYLVKVILSEVASATHSNAGDEAFLSLDDTKSRVHWSKRPKTKSVKDYKILHLWSISASSLSCFNAFRVFKLKPSSSNKDILLNLPLRCVQIFNQTFPLFDLQRANFNSCLETRVPFVALFVIDANRKLFYIDPLSGTYSLLSNKMVETIHVIGQDGIFQHSTNASYEEMNVCAYNDVLVVKYYCTESRKPPSRPVDVALLISLVIGVTDTDTIPENISMVAYNNFISLLVPVSHYEDEFVTALSSIANGIFRINKQYHSLSVSNKLENNRVTSSKQTICERSTHFAVVMSCLHHYQRSVDVNNNDFKAVPFGVSDKHNMKVLYDTRYHVEDNEIYSVVTSNLNRNTDSITNGTMRTNSADATQANNFCSINFSKEKVPVVRNSVHSPTSKDNKFSLDTYERRFPLPEIVLFAMTTDAINYAKAHSNSGQMLLQLLEETMKTFIEKANFSDVKTQLNYRLFMSFLYRCDAEFQLELVSRLGRKLEPTVSKKVFPVPTVALNSIENRFTAKTKLSSVLSLFEKSLMDKNVDHATRLLTLACESVGGTETHHSTVASLFLSWELFLHCVTTMSLNNSLECFEFCCRLESLIIVHCGYVFARDSPVAATKHSIDKYIQEVAGQASSAIEIVRDGKQINSPVKCNENIAKSPNGREPNNVAPTANKSLPLYVGEGIAWIFSQTINTFIDTEDDNKVSEISTRRSTADERTRLSITDQSERSGTINSEQPGYLAREWLMLTIGKVKFDLLLCGIPLSCSDAINRSLKSFYFPNTSSNFGANYGWMPFYESPSIVLLSVLLEDLLESHSYYSAAVVLLTMLRSRSVFELIREQLYEKLRLQLVEVSMDQTGRSMQPRIAEVFNRLIHAFRLHKSVRNDQELLQNRLDQPLQVQYIRRVIESERNSKYYKDFATETESVSTIVNNISSGIAVEEKVGELLTEEQLAIEALIRKINSQNKVHNYYELPEDFLTTTCLRKSHTDSKHVSNGSVDSDTKLCTRDFLKVTAIAFLLSSTNNYVIAGSIMELMEPVKYLQLSTAGNERIDQIVEFFMPN